MTQYDETNRGVLFKNNEKKKENSPDYTGKINVDGVEKQISAWINTSNAGNKYMSIKCSDPMERNADQAEPSSTVQNDAPLDDEIPF